ncbi:MAG: hypothetical protein ACYDCQ_12555 [Dehalococcoidia bacterium]
MWYTLVRFKDAPQYITGVSQAKTAADALSLAETWERDFAGETTVVFDPKNAPVNRRNLAEAAAKTPAGAPAGRGLGLDRSDARVRHANR